MRNTFLTICAVTALTTGTAGAAVVSPFQNGGEEPGLLDPRNLNLKLLGDNLDVGVNVLNLLRVDESFRDVVDVRLGLFTLTDLSSDPDFVPNFEVELSISPPGPVWGLNLMSGIVFDFSERDQSRAFFRADPATGNRFIDMLFFRTDYNFRDKELRGEGGIDTPAGAFIGFGIQYTLSANACRPAGSGLVGSFDCDFDQGTVTADYRLVPIPLPASALLLLTALAGLGALRVHRAA